MSDRRAITRERLIALCQETQAMEYMPTVAELLVHELWPVIDAELARLQSTPPSGSRPCYFCDGSGEVEVSRPCIPIEDTGGMSELTGYATCEKCGGTGQALANEGQGLEGRQGKPDAAGASGKNRPVPLPDSSSVPASGRSSAVLRSPDAPSEGAPFTAGEVDEEFKLMMSRGIVIAGAMLRAYAALLRQQAGGR